MKKKILFAFFVSAISCMLAFSVNATAPLPEKPDIGVDFGEVTLIGGFAAPSELFTETTERILLIDGEGQYVTYPTYYVTKDSLAFDFDFSRLNEATGKEYGKGSIVMIEVPKGITAIPNSFFSNAEHYCSCLSVQIPGTVTSYGQYMFNKNSVIRIVEFLDGDEPVTMGDMMFGAEWNGGAYMIGYVKFPNNLVSIGNNTFGKAQGSSKVIILGANLKSIGTGFLSQATPEMKDTFIYVSDNFFAEEELRTSLFGDFQQWHDNHLMLTIFYTGTEAQARAFVDKGLAVEPTGYIWDKITLVSASEYDYEIHRPKARMNTTIVFDYDGCQAFYGGHRMSEDLQMQFAGYFKDVLFATECENPGCDLKEIDNSKTISAMLTYKGYSFSQFADANGTFAMCQSFVINKDSIERYKGITDNDLSFGVLAKGNPSGEEIDPLPGDSGVLSRELSYDLYNLISVKALGITEKHMDTSIVFCAYVIDGGQVFYLDGGETRETVKGTSYNSVLNLSK